MTSPSRSTVAVREMTNWSVGLSKRGKCVRSTLPPHDRYLLGLHRGASCAFARNRNRCSRTWGPDDEVGTISGGAHGARADVVIHHRLRSPSHDCRCDNGRRMRRWRREHASARPLARTDASACGLHDRGRFMAAIERYVHEGSGFQPRNGRGEDCL